MKHSENKKTIMKKNQKTTDKTLNPKPSITAEKSGTDTRPKIDFALRRANRKLNTDSVVGLLQEKAPSFFAVAEVVGKWVWIQFTVKQPIEITKALSELGFHWNNTRQTWQHPCGTIADERATYDPRKRYGSYFPAKA